jgi:hypothetical protein
MTYIQSNLVICVARRASRLILNVMCDLNVRLEQIKNQTYTVDIQGDM